MLHCLYEADRATYPDERQRVQCTSIESCPARVQPPTAMPIVGGYTANMRDWVAGFGGERNVVHIDSFLGPCLIYISFTGLWQIGPHSSSILPPLLIDFAFLFGLVAGGTQKLHRGLIRQAFGYLSLVVPRFGCLLRFVCLLRLLWLHGEAFPSPKSAHSRCLDLCY